MRAFFTILTTSVTLFSLLILALSVSFPFLPAFVACTYSLLLLLYYLPSLLSFNVSMILFCPFIYVFLCHMQSTQGLYFTITLRYLYFIQVYISMLFDSSASPFSVKLLYLHYTQICNGSIHSHTSKDLRFHTVTHIITIWSIISI